MHINIISRQCRRFMTCFSLTALMSGMAACSTQSPPTVRLEGAGASLPAPLYDMWFFKYERQHPEVQIDYASIGSGAGIEQFLAQEVDFASTDAPLTSDEIKQLPQERGSVIQLPVAGSAIVLAYNLDGVDALKLSRQAYCGIATGEIATWNHPAIAANNPNVALPDQPITFVHREDSSGSTYIFTNHLNAACNNWMAGAGKEADWATGITGSGNEGVTAAIKQTEGAIGYIGFAYAERNFMPMASLENQAGYYIEPSPNAAELATTRLATTSDLTATTSPDPARADAYPIVGLIYMLLYENYAANDQAQAMGDFIKWALADGKSIADTLGYAPLSPELAVLVTERLDMLETSQLDMGQLP